MGKGRAAKCKICKKLINTNDAYKITNGKTNLYYCSEEHYKEGLKEKEFKERLKEARGKVFQKMQDILGSNMDFVAIQCIIPEFFNIDDLNKMFSYLEDNEDYLTGTMNKKNKFINNYVRMKYFCAIIRNNLPDYEMPEQEEYGKEIEFDGLEYKFKPKKRRRTLEELEDL